MSNHTIKKLKYDNIDTMAEVAVRDQQGRVIDNTYVDNTNNQVIDGQKDFTVNPRMFVHGHPEDIVITNTDYEQVDYIENIYPKHAYINTGFRLNQNSKIEISYSITKSFSVGTSFAVCGARASKTSSAFNLWGSLADGPIGVNFGNLGAISSSIMPEVNTVYNVSLDKNSLIVNNQITSLSSTPNFTTPVDCWIFDFPGSSATGGSTGSVYLWGRVYQCKIYDNGTLARNLYPCYRKSDSVAGMYDIANDVFYPSQTADLFRAGPELKDRYENLLTDANFADVAFTGNYNDLENKPNIPAVYNGVLTIKRNNTSIGTFSANSSSSSSVNITVPTDTSDLTNDAGFITSSYHDSTKQDTLIEGNGISINNDVISIDDGVVALQTDLPEGEVSLTLTTTSLSDGTTTLTVPTEQTIKGYINKAYIESLFDNGDEEEF